jgi:Flp pilus assembly pilin Flp
MLEPTHNWHFPRDWCRGVVLFLDAVHSQGFARRRPVAKFLHQLWSDERGQDVAEYAVMLAVVLVIVVGTIRLIGANANNVFSSVSSSIAQ